MNPISMPRRPGWRWRDLPLRYKGFVIVAIPLVPLLVTSALFYDAERRSAGATADVEHTLRVKSELARLLSLFADAELSARGYLLTHGPDALATFEDASAQIPTVIARVRELVSDNPDQLWRVNRVPEHARERPLSELIEYADRTTTSASLPLELLARSRAVMRTLRDDIETMQEAEDTLLERRAREAARARAWAVRVAMAGGAIGVLGGLCAALIVTSTIVRRVDHVSDNARRLIDGVEPEPSAPAGDEIGDLAFALHHASGLLRERDAALRHRLEDVAAANRELEAFSYSVSHDLRAPLRHVAGFASLLQRHAAGTLDAESRRYLGLIVEAAARMGRLVDDLLGFSRMGRGELQRSRVDLNDLVTDVRNEMALQTAGREIAWTVSPLPVVEGDPALLRVVVMNLLANAVKYTSTRPLARIEIGGESRDGECVMFVRDNGVGFDMAYVGKLFGVFQRLHADEEFEGTGIGLANVRRIMQRHGGRAWASGAIDEGATFFISLPEADRVA